MDPNNNKNVNQYSTNNIPYASSTFIRNKIVHPTVMWWAWFF